MGFLSWLKKIFSCGHDHSHVEQDADPLTAIVAEMTWNEDRPVSVEVTEHGNGYAVIQKNGQPGIACFTCRKVSYHPQDIASRYCAHCKRFHSVPLS